LTIKFFLLKLKHNIAPPEPESIWTPVFKFNNRVFHSDFTIAFWKTIVTEKRFSERDRRDVGICFFGRRSSLKKDFGEKLVFAFLEDDRQSKKILERVKLGDFVNY